MSEPLYLIRLQLDAQKLVTFARRSRAATMRDLDEGYAVHAALSALFDHQAPEGEKVAPKPFHITSAAGRTVDVLGYSSADHRALVARAETFADPWADGVCDLAGMASRRMPAIFEPGTRLGFTARACPVRRVPRRGPLERERAEVDAFLAKAWAVGSDVALRREDVYLDWLREELGRGGASRAIEATVAGFQLGRLRRRTQEAGGEGRKGRSPQRPDVSFEGILEVLDSAAFASLLARGLGRHRTFGFGMLLLRPAPRR